MNPLLSARMIPHRMDMSVTEMYPCLKGLRPNKICGSDREMGKLLWLSREGSVVFVVSDVAPVLVCLDSFIN